MPMMTVMAEDDADEDGYGDVLPGPLVTPGTDCNDQDDTLNALDFDQDNFSTCDGDCLDTDPYTFPGAAENEPGILCMQDLDDDGYGSSEPPEGVIPFGDREDKRN